MALSVVCQCLRRTKRSREGGRHLSESNKYASETLEKSIENGHSWRNAEKKSTASFEIPAIFSFDDVKRLDVGD